jgi:hypothetical protein
MPTVFAAILVPDEAQFGGVDTNSFQTFTNATQQAAAALTQAQGTTVGTKLFVAPEYYFSSMGGGSFSSSSVAPVSRSNKHDLYDQLKSLSQANSDILMVAGSIFYQKSGGFFSSSQKGYNVVPVLHNGKFLHKYYKRMDDGNVKGADASATFDYKEKKPVFTLNGVTYGIEVCGENSDPQHSLQKWTQTSGSSRVDVHVWLSGTTGHTKSNIAARSGGYCVHCDMQESRNQVEKVTGTQIMMSKEYFKSSTSEVPVYQSAPLANGSRVDVYRLDL